MYFLKRYNWVIHIAVILVCSYYLARAVTTYVAGALEAGGTAEEIAVPEVADEATTEEGEEEEDIKEKYRVVLERNIFNSAESALEAVATEESLEDQMGELGEAVQTSLGIKVMSTLVVGDGTDRRSSAIVEGGSSKKGQAYFPGEEESFAPNVKLVKVAKDRIEFINGGRLEFAELEDFMSKKSVFASAEEVFGAAKLGDDSKQEKTATDSAPTGTKIVLDQKDVDEALQNLDKLYTDVRIIPNFRAGKPSGMKVLSIKPGSLASKLGIRRGDVLSRVNGEELDIRRGAELFNNLKDLKNFSLEVVRGGKNRTLEYEIR